MSNSRPYQHFYSQSLHSEVVLKNVNTTYVHVKYFHLNMHVIKRVHSLSCGDIKTFITKCTMLKLLFVQSYEQVEVPTTNKYIFTQFTINFQTFVCSKLCAGRSPYHQQIHCYTIYNSFSNSSLRKPSRYDNGLNSCRCWMLSSWNACVHKTQTIVKQYKFLSVCAYRTSFWNFFTKPTVSLNSDMVTMYVHAKFRTRETFLFTKFAFRSCHKKC